MQSVRNHKKIVCCSNGRIKVIYLRKIMLGLCLCAVSCLEFRVLG